MKYLSVCSGIKTTSLNILLAGEAKLRSKNTRGQE